MSAALPVDPTVLAHPDPNRGRSKLPPFLWSLLGAAVFRFSPKPLYKVRNKLVNLFGGRIDPTVRLRPSVAIDRPWNLEMGRKSSLGDGVVVWAHAPVSIGARTTISQYCRLAAFSCDDAGVSEPAPLAVGADCWIAAESYVAGGQSVPDGVLVGARSLVDGPLDEWTIAAGEPAVSRRPRPFKGRDL